MDLYPNIPAFGDGCPGEVPNCPAAGCCPCPDLDDDGDVDNSDLLLLIAAWGACPTPGCREDLNCDGTVGSPDLLILIAAWGPSEC